MLKCRLGITTNPEKQKERWMKLYPEMMGWRDFGPFERKEDAKLWESKNTLCEKVTGDEEEEEEGKLWWCYGFYFEDTTTGSKEKKTKSAKPLLDFSKELF